MQRSDEFRLPLEDTSKKEYLRTFNMEYDKPSTSNYSLSDVKDSNYYPQKQYLREQALLTKYLMPRRKSHVNKHLKQGRVINTESSKKISSV